MSEAAVILAGQAVLVALLAGWLVLGAIENIRKPEVNFALVRDILSMRRVAEFSPEIYAEVGGNRIDDPRIHRLLFRVIVGIECVVAVALCIGAGMLALAAFGAGDAGTARVVAIAAVAGFTAIWGGFLVGGQWFHYWAGAEGAQMTHYMMTIWGVATFVALT
jgi:predicted small integral membrane protein